MMPVDVVRYEGKRRRPVTPVPQIIAAPSAFHRALDWRQQVIRSWLDAGNAWGLVTQTTPNAAYPTRIELQNPDDVVPAPEVRDGPAFRIRGEVHYLWPVGDLWHRPAYTMPGSFIGVSPLRLHAETIGTGLAAAKFGAEFVTVPEGLDRRTKEGKALWAELTASGRTPLSHGDAELIGIQKKIILHARRHNKAVIVATQMMESMIQNPVPTRAEVSDVANAVLDGTDAVMLSAETAAGKYPLETVEEMAKICEAAENAEDPALDADFKGQTFSRIDQSIAMGALFTAHHLGAKAIVALTDSGSTALWMSRHRIHIPIYALTSKVATQRKMALYRNVRPLFMDQWPADIARPVLVLAAYAGVSFWVALALTRKRFTK